MTIRQNIGKTATYLTKLLHLDVRFYGRSFAWISMGQASSIIRGIATTFLMARWLPKENLGEFRYILALFGVAGIFSLSGLNTSIIRGVSKGDTGIARAAIKRILLFSPLGSLVLLIAALERWMQGEVHVAIGLIIAAIAFPFNSVSGMYGAILTGKEEIKKLVKIAVINNLLYSILFVSVILKTKEILFLLVAYFGFDIVFRGFMTWREVRKLPKTKNLQEHIRLGNHMSAIGAFQALAMQFDQILIQRFFGYGSLANYSIAILIPTQIINAVNGMSGIILRRFSLHKHSETITKQARHHFWTAMGLSTLFVAIYITVAPIIIPWLFPQYSNQILPTIIYSLGLIGICSMVGVNFMQAHNQIRQIWAFYAVNTIIQIGANLLLIPFFGGWGAILTKTTSRLINIPMAYPKEKKITKNLN